jgi:hypothetical protein
MGYVDRTRYIYFRVIDIDSAPVTGLTLGNFVKYFKRDNVTCADTVTIQELGSGRYLASYVPSAVGFDFLELYNATHDVRIQDEEQIETVSTLFGVGSETVDLTEDYGSVGRFTVTASQPEDYILYLFKSIDWEQGRTNPSYAEIATEITSAGNWVSTPLTVLKDTYHVVAINSIGSVNILAAFLRVE